MNSVTKFSATLADLNPKSNSIGFIRLFCALAVIVAHCQPYGGFGTEILARWSNNQIGLGRVAVDVFFIISGFLIAMSWSNINNLRRFVWHRFLRIYPAFWVCLVITGIILPWYVRGSPSIGYVAKSFACITGVQIDISGVFDDNPCGGQLNSALWTLPWEIRAYFFLAVLGACGFINTPSHKWVLVLIFLATWIGFIVQIYSFPGIDTSPAISSGWRLLSFFFIGALFFEYRHQIHLKWGLFVASITIMIFATIAGMLWLNYSGGLFDSVSQIPLAYAVFYMATRLPLVFNSINTTTDISYGIYIYGTLVINILVSTHFFASYFMLLIAVLFITIPVAYLSWYWIEAPSLSFKNRLRF